MKKNYNNSDIEKAGSIVTVGTFDGVHSGHREVLRTVTRAARELGLRPLVVTFDRHPLEIVAPQRAPRLLQSREERDELLRAEGVEVIEVPFTRELASLTARQWIARLRDSYGARAIVTGYDNTFGCDGRSMSKEDYLNIGTEAGLKVIVAPELPGVCSTEVRKALRSGDVTRAAEMLGRPYSVKGKVISGRRLGRTLGFPTANVDVDDKLLLPSPGVYAGTADGMAAVINVGDNPTVSDGNPVTVEAHLIDFDGNLYDREMKLVFLKRIRDEKKFETLDALKERIRLDCLQAREILWKGV